MNGGVDVSVWSEVLWPAAVWGGYCHGFLIRKEFGLLIGILPLGGRHGLLYWVSRCGGMASNPAKWRCNMGEMVVWLAFFVWV